MKVSQKKYDLKFRNKNQLKLERSLRAANRLESYSFYQSDTSSLLSSEIQGNLILKREFYESKSHESIWTDRNSLIAAPYNSELFLQNDRLMSSERFLGAPRFYFHELSSPSKIPNAQIRFPYDRVAHKSSKIISRLFRYNLNRRLHAAIILKRNFRKYLKNKLSTMEMILWNKCITMLQNLFRRRRNLFKENALWYREKYLKELERKKLLFEEDKRKNLLGAQKIRLTIAFYHLTRRAKEFIKRKRRERGIRRREYNFACRLQAVYRGRKTRKMLRNRKSAGIFLLFCLRRYWKRKHLKDVLRIQRTYRNYQLRKKVIMIQNMIRRKIGQRKYHRLILEMIANERHRANRECLVMTDYLSKLSLDLRWMNDEEQIPFITTEDHLKRIDFYSLCVLTNNPLQLMEPYHESIHPADYGEDDYVDPNNFRLNTCTSSTSSHTPGTSTSTSNTSHGGGTSTPNNNNNNINNFTFEQKVTMTILNLFANRPGYCLDGPIFSILKLSNYFYPLENLNLWESLEKIPLLNIYSLFHLLKPTKSLLLQIKLFGYGGRYLPTQLLWQALLINRWTLFYEFLLKRKLKRFRKLYPPRRACPYCLEPMIFDGQLYDHRRCCRNGFPSWMVNDMKDIYRVLVEQCMKVERLREIRYQRDYGSDLKRLKEGMRDLTPGGGGATEGGGEGKGKREEGDDHEAALEN
jgi:hypothetical protein